MTKAVEQSEAERRAYLQRMSEADYEYFPRATIEWLLATIEARDARIAELERQADKLASEWDAAENKARNEKWRAEEAEARVSELEKALEPFVSIGNMLTQYPSGAAILYQASGDPSMKITSDHCHAAVAAMFPTPPVKGE